MFSTYFSNADALAYCQGSTTPEPLQQFFPTMTLTPVDFDMFKARLVTWFNESDRPRRITFIFGAGLPIALTNSDSNATWAGLLAKLVKEMEKQMFPTGVEVENWFKKASITHRMHIIGSLAAGDSDMCVATTYLLDRFQRLFFEKNELVWQQKLNELTVKFEKAAKQNAAKARSKPLDEHCKYDSSLLNWEALLGRMGHMARTGKCLLATTNFDHLLAQFSNLPIYLARLNHSESGVNLPHGYVIEQAQLREEKILGQCSAESACGILQPSAAAFRSLWRQPSTYPSNWYGELASVLHIHGSRLLPQSLVFDPSGYHRVAYRNGEENLLGRLIQTPSESGAIITVGCGDTLLDPHFSTYWKRAKNQIDTTTENNDTGRMMGCLHDDDTVLERCRLLSTPDLHDLPAMVKAGSHADLPKKLGELLDLLD